MLDFVCVCIRRLSLSPAADAASEAVTSTPVRMTTDRYGFLIPNEGTPGASTSASDSSPAMTKEMTRVKKWQKMLGEVPPMVPFDLSLSKLLRFHGDVRRDVSRTAMLLLGALNTTSLQLSWWFACWRFKTCTAVLVYLSELAPERLYNGVTAWLNGWVNGWVNRCMSA